MYPFLPIALLSATGALALQSARPAKLVMRSPATLDFLFGSGLSTRQISCDEQECADGCIPLDAMCCDVIVGIYCEAGETCTTSNTCCPDGQSCGGSSTKTCDDNEKKCGAGCMPTSAECCSDALSMYCEKGYTCDTSSTCLPDDASSNSDDSDSKEDDDKSSSNDDNKSSTKDNDKSSSTKQNDEKDGGLTLRPSLMAIGLGAMITLFCY